MDSNDITSLLSGVMNNPEMMSKIQGILSNPEAMQSITNAVSGLGIGSEEKNEQKENKETFLPMSATQSLEAKNRARLISALKPYLNEERRDKAEKLMGLLTLLEVSGALKKH